jgi:hypothetical protein
MQRRNTLVRFQTATVMLLFCLSEKSAFAVQGIPA